MKFNSLAAILAVSLIAFVNLNCGETSVAFGVKFSESLPPYMEENATFDLLAQTVNADGNVTYQWSNQGIPYPQETGAILSQNVGIITNGCDKSLLIEVVATDSAGHTASATTKSLVSKSVCQYLKPGTINSTAVNKVAVDNTQGNIFVGTSEGLSLFDGNNWSRLDHTDGLIGNEVAGNEVTGLWMDELKEDLWLSVSGGGGGLQKINLRNGVSAGKIYAWNSGWMAGSLSIVTSSDGSAFSAKSTNDAIEKTDVNGTLVKKYLAIPGVTALATGPDQTFMWIGTNDPRFTGLILKNYNQATDQNITTNWPQAANNHSVNTIAVDGNMVYVGLNNAGSTTAGGMQVGLVTNSYGIANTTVSWIGNHSSANTVGGIFQSNVKSIVVAKNHDVWLATDTDIYLYTFTLTGNQLSNEIFRKWPSSALKPANGFRITDMAYDTFNDALWVGTANDGLIKIVPSLLKNAS